MTKVFVQYVEPNASSTHLIANDLLNFLNTSNSKILRSNQMLRMRPCGRKLELETLILSFSVRGYWQTLIPRVTGELAWTVKTREKSPGSLRVQLVMGSPKTIAAAEDAETNCPRKNLSAESSVSSHTCILV